MKNLLVIVSLSLWVSSAAQGNFALAIHGGAGTILPENMTPEKRQQIENSLLLAIKTGSDILEKGGSALDAVTETVKVLENCPHFNAGKGAVFTAEGRNELDASIMDGKTGMAGAVAGVTNIKNPVTAARAVMEKSPHVMLTGKGAETFARKMRLEMISPKYFRTEERWREYLRVKRQQDSLARDRKFGTVGCVALDLHGNLAAATSTGGMTWKKFGRVGDAPIIGAGTYADNATCAVSATGHGEYFIRNVVAYDISALMKYKGLTLEEAARSVIGKLGPIGGTGGVIALDAAGNVTMPFNTRGMYRGYLKQGEAPVVKMFQE